MSQTLTDPDTAPGTFGEQPCQIVTRVRTRVGRTNVVVETTERCSQVAAFEVITICAAAEAAGLPGRRRLICAEHEQGMRDQPERSICSDGHPSRVVGILPLGGDS